MPDKKTIERAKKDDREGKSVSTQAGEFVRSEIHKIRGGEHGVRSSAQAIAIGLNEARRAGVDVPAPKKGTTSRRTRKSAKAASDAGHRHPHGKPSPKRSRATMQALKREGRSAASHKAPSTHARKAASKRSAASRSASARKAARTRARRGS